MNIQGNEMELETLYPSQPLEGEIEGDNVYIDGKWVDWSLLPSEILYLRKIIEETHKHLKDREISLARRMLEHTMKRKI